MNYKKIVYGNLEKELEAVMGILKLKKGIVMRPGWSEKVKKTPFQIKVLQEIFKITEFPSTGTRKDLSLLLSIPQRSIQVWFQNTRQAKRKHRDSLADQGICAHSSSDTENEDISLTQLVDIIRSVKYGVLG